jgi:hypothetical protein
LPNPPVITSDPPGRLSSPRDLANQGALSALVAVSYLTTALRDAYLVKQANRFGSVDKAVLSAAIGSTVAASVGLALWLMYGIGKDLKKVVFLLLALFIASVALIPMSPYVGLALVSGCYLTIFQLGQAFAAHDGHVQAVGVASTLSSFATIAVWMKFGVGSPAAIAGGFATGGAVQSLAALVLGRKRWLDRKAISSANIGAGGLMSIIALSSLAQLGLLLARIPFVGSPKGELASASLAMVLVFSATAVLAAPTALLNLVGKRGLAVALLQKLSYVTAVGLFTFFLLVGKASVWVGDVGTQASMRTVSGHGMVFALAAPAVTHLYVRVRRSTLPSETPLLSGPLVAAALFQLGFFAVTRLYEFRPAFLGFGFVLSQWLAFFLDQRSIKARSPKSEAVRTAQQRV